MTYSSFISMFVSVLLLPIYSIYSQNDLYIGKDRSTKISFYSDAPLEKIEAINTTATPVFKASTGEFQIRIPMQGFQFKNNLMQEHFNENYVESDKYPYCTFKGKLEQIPQLENNQEKKVFVIGKIELHGVTKDVKIEGTIKKVGNELVVNSIFFLKPADYNIKIPSLFSQRIAEEVKVTFSSTLIPYIKK